MMMKAFEVCASIFLLLFLLVKLIAFILSYMDKKPIPSHSNSAVFITGASSGIGRCIALNFARKGIEVFATVRKEKDAEDLKQAHCKLNPVIVDVVNEEGMQEAAHKVESELAQKNLNLICVIANAGVLQKEGSVDRFDLARAKMVVDVNVIGVMQTIRFFMPLLSSSGRVFVSGSYFGSSTLPLMSAYSGSKFFLEGYCDGIRKSLYKKTRAITLLKIGNISTKLNPTMGESGPQVVFDGLWSSLGSAYPQARIYAGTVGKMSTRIWCGLCEFLPTPIYDYFTHTISSASGGGSKH